MLKSPIIGWERIGEEYYEYYLEVIFFSCNGTNVFTAWHGVVQHSGGARIVLASPRKNEH